MGSIVQWIVFLAIFLLIFIFYLRYFLIMLMNRNRVKKYFNGSVSIGGVMGAGKSALASSIANDLKVVNKGNVYSTFPIKLNGKENTRILPFMVLTDFKKKGSYFPFNDGDSLIFDEIGLSMSSSDYKNDIDLRSNAGLFLKLSRHMFNGPVITIEQHPQRLPINIREKTELFISIEERITRLGLIIWKLQAYTMLEDYGREIPRKKKDRAKAGFVGKCYKFSIVKFKKKVYDSYDTRALSGIGDIKRLEHERICDINDTPIFKNHPSVMVDSLEHMNLIGLQKINDILNTDIEKEELVKERKKRKK